jgi:hypothetical protein
MGARMISSWTCAAAAAASTFAISKSGSKNAMLSAIVPDSSRSSCETTPTCARHARHSSGSARLPSRSDRPRCRAVQSEQQFQESGLAAARRPGKGNELPRHHFEVDVLKHELVGDAIAERQIANLDCAPNLETPHRCGFGFRNGSDDVGKPIEMQSQQAELDELIDEANGAPFEVIDRLANRAQRAAVFGSATALSIPKTPSIGFAIASENVRFSQLTCESLWRPIFGESPEVYAIFQRDILGRHS